jgi:glycerol-3-phosphate O-acyltransferase 3/4
LQWARDSARRNRERTLDKQLKAATSDDDEPESAAELTDDATPERQRHVSARRRALTDCACTAQNFRAGLIDREGSERIAAKLSAALPVSRGRVFTFADDSLDFIKAGIEAVVEDEVTSRFLAEDLATWNMLTRTHQGLQSYKHYGLVGVFLL